MKHLRLAVALMLLSLTAPLQAQNRLPLTQTITVSGTSQPFPNSNGSMQVSFEEKIAGAPSTISIVIQGCKLGNTCDTLDTYTTVANAIRPPSSSLTKVYDSFVVTASWTGGSNVVVTINATLTTASAGNGSSGGAVSSVFTRTGDVVAAAGDYNLSQISPGAAGIGTWDFTGVTLLKARLAAGLTTTVNGDFGFDTTNLNWHGWNGADGIFPLVPVGTPVNGQCPTWVVSSGKVSFGAAACGAAGANTALSNLVAPSINTSLLAQTGVDLGGTSNPFRNLYLFGSGTYGSTYFQLTGTPTSTRTVTFPDNTGSVAELNFAQTWSALQTFGGLTGTGSIDFSGSTISKLRVGAGLTTSANGDIGYDTTNKNWHLWQNGADALAAIWSGALTSGHCPQILVVSSVTTLVDSGSVNCGGLTNPLTTSGDIFIGGPAGAPARLPVNASSLPESVVSVSGVTSLAPASLNVDPQTGDYTFSCPTDRFGEIEFNITSPHGFYLPQAGSTTCAQSSMGMVVRNTSTSAAILTLCSGTGANGTCTPGSSTFQPEATNSINLIPGAAAFVYSDATTSTGNYHVIPIASPFGGANTQTANYTATLLDKDKLIIMNCSGACALTLPATPPSSKWGAWIMSIGSTLATVSLNSLNFNGGASAPALIKYMPIMVRTDGSNYFGDAPLVGSAQVTVTPTANGVALGIGATSIGSAQVDSSVVTDAGNTTTTGGKVAVSTTTAGKVNYLDFPERFYIPSANCNITTAGAGWSIPAGGTVTCRGGTNNLGGYITITDTSSTFAQFTLMLPVDWDTATNPYIKFYFSSASDTTNGHTVIPQIKVSCPTAANGTTSDDATFSAAQSSSTVTFGASAVANGFYNGSSVQIGATQMTGCIAGGMMIVQVGRATDTATGNINFYGADVTFPRLLVVQAN
jgi:hypothetical protein